MRTYGVTTDYDRNDGRTRDYLQVWSGPFASERVAVGVSLPRGDGYMLTTYPAGEKIRVTCPTPRNDETWQEVDRAISAALSAHYGETEPAARVGDVLSCGHPLTEEMVNAAGSGTGYARTTDGRVLCYAHADDEQRAEMSRADVFTAYADRHYLTTWSGGRLAATVSMSASRSGWNGSDVYAWRFRADDGSEWHGRNGGPGMVINVRRAKRATR